MTYHLGRHSLEELKGVHPDLVRVVEDAIAITDQDFTVVDGHRTFAEQEEYVRRGVSQTLKSRHLTQADGHGHAVDLVPYINGRVRWELAPMYEIARAVRRAATRLSVRIRWGGCWRLLTGTAVDPEILVARYLAGRLGLGRRPFVDGPHYEIKL